MNSTMHPVEFHYTLQELEAIFRYAHEHDVEKGGRYDARSAAVNVWSHHWQHPATMQESETIGTFYVHWQPTPVLQTASKFPLRWWIINSTLSRRDQLA